MEKDQKKYLVLGSWSRTIIVAISFASLILLFRYNPLIADVSTAYQILTTVLVTYSAIAVPLIIFVCSKLNVSLTPTVLDYSVILAESKAILLFFIGILITVKVAITFILLSDPTQLKLDIILTICLTALTTRILWEIICIYRNRNLMEIGRVRLFSRRLKLLAYIAALFKIKPERNRLNINIKPESVTQKLYSFSAQAPANQMIDSLMYSAIRNGIQRNDEEYLNLSLSSLSELATASMRIQPCCLVLEFGRTDRFFNKTMKGIGYISEAWLHIMNAALIEENEQRMNDLFDFFLSLIVDARSLYCIRGFRILFKNLDELYRYVIYQYVDSSVFISVSIMNLLRIILIDHIELGSQDEWADNLFEDYPEYLDTCIILLYDLLANSLRKSLFNDFKIFVQGSNEILDSLKSIGYTDFIHQVEAYLLIIRLSILVNNRGGDIVVWYRAIANIIPPNADSNIYLTALSFKEQRTISIRKIVKMIQPKNVPGSYYIPLAVGYLLELTVEKSRGSINLKTLLRQIELIVSKLPNPNWIQALVHKYIELSGSAGVKDALGVVVQPFGSVPSKEYLKSVDDVKSILGKILIKRIISSLINYLRKR